jgi:DNA-binding GntR family transcriptional regulator
MIVASGFKVWPREVEEVLYLHPAVREAAVIGIADPYRGETIKAVISLKAGQQVTVNEIKAFARERMAAYKYPRVVEIVDDLPKTTSGKIMRRLLQTTAAPPKPLPGSEVDFASVSYPELRAAIEARALMEVGAVWLRLSRGSIPRSTSEALYDRLHAMLSHLDDRLHFVDRDAFFAANEAYHAAVIDLAENEHLSRAFRRLRLREQFVAALKDTPATPHTVVLLHELQTDAIAAGNAEAAAAAILSWGDTSHASIRAVLGVEKGDLQPLNPAGVVEDLTVAQAKDQKSLAGDVDALVAALDARAALEIGIARALGTALTGESERDALVARLRAFTPLVRGNSPAHLLRYIRADEAFHRVFFSLLHNRTILETYNSMDLPELMRRVLESAPPSIREVFDDHKELTDAVRGGHTHATAAAITRHANQIRASLAEFVAHERAPAQGAA